MNFALHFRLVLVSHSWAAGGEHLSDLKEKGHFGLRDIAFPRARSIPTCTIAGYQESRDLLTEVFPEL